MTATEALKQSLDGYIFLRGKKAYIGACNWLPPIKDDNKEYGYYEMMLLKWYSDTTRFTEVNLVELEDICSLDWMPTNIAPSINNYYPCIDNPLFKTAIIFEKADTIDLIKNLLNFPEKWIETRIDNSVGTAIIFKLGGLSKKDVSLDLIRYLLDRIQL